MLLVQWGRRNAGPLLLAEYARALEPHLSGRLHVSGNSVVEEAVRPPVSIPCFDVTTYSSAVGVLLGAPRLIVQALRLRQYVRRHRIGTVFAPMFSLWQTLALSLWLPPDVHYVSAVHDAEDHPGERNPVRDLCRAIELRRADTLVTFSRGVTEAIRRRRPDCEVLQLQLGAPPAEPARSAPAGVPVVGFFGRLVAYKGLQVFVEAVALAASARPVRGAVYGSGDVDPALLQGDVPVDWKVGYVAEEQVASVLRGFDLLVLPYQEASQSGVVLQAFAAGLPVVATPVGGLREQVEHRGGVIADDQGATALARSIVALLEDADRYEGLSRTAVATARAMGWAEVSEPLVALLAARSK